MDEIKEIYNKNTDRQGFELIYFHKIQKIEIK